MMRRESSSQLGDIVFLFFVPADPGFWVDEAGV
jgi:hypothetical protein